MIYDVFQNTEEVSASNDIAIITIDEKSIREMGIWPWPRSVHSTLVERLETINPKVITFDILFTEPDSRNSDGDKIFSNSLRRSGKVVLPALHIQNGQPSDGIRLQPPIPILNKYVAQLAHVDAAIDHDGLVRSVFLKAGVGQSNLSALGLAAFETANNHTLTQLSGLTRDTRIPIEAQEWVRNNQVLIPLSNTRNRFSTYSYTDVLNNHSILEALRGKIIFIGVTAAGISTNLPVPYSTNHALISSVFYHAAITDALLSNQVITASPSTWIYGAGSFLVVLLLFIMNTFSKPGASFLITVFFIFLSIVLSLFLLSKMALWLPPASIIIALLISCPLWCWRRAVAITQQLTLEKDRAEITLQSIADGVISINQFGKIRFMNPVAEQLTGFSNTEALNQSIERIFHIRDLVSKQKIEHKLLQYLQQKNKTSPHEKFSLMSRSGDKYVIRATIGKIPDSSYFKGSRVLAFSDVTETSNLLDQMFHQATYDTLTDLPNRALLTDRLNQSISFAQRNEYQVAVLFIDIDQFKKINDGFGHEVGDQLLRQIADRLKENLRGENTAARLGGDEFVIVLDKISEPQAVAGVTKKILTQFKAPFLLNDREFHITCSIGISIYPQDATNAETLLKNSDIAMYSAKDRGRNNFQYFSANMNTVIQDKLYLEKELRIAFEKGQLEVFFQPQINSQSLKITGVEALLRWQHEKLGSISPSKFIPLAEDTGLIIPIGEWVLRTACAQVNEWNDYIDDEFSIAINLSPRQFLGQNVIDILKQSLVSEKIEAKRIKLEITEGLFVAEESNIEFMLEEFRHMGGMISIDDFGTGYSSLSYLKRIPVDQIKIDRSFVQDIANNERSCSLIKAIISMAHDMGLDVIAEGVENTKQLKILEDYNCLNMQGFYFSRAVEAEKITALLKGQSSIVAKTPFDSRAVADVEG